MRKSNVQLLGEALKEFLSADDCRKLREKLQQTAVTEALQELLGAKVVYVQGMYLRERKVYMSVTSSALRSELVMQRASLTERVNAAVGEQVIDEIIVR
ncbi:MAG: DUF721 domain-containing protein [Tannerellaceae bacterium]|jgi:hypothetical protein|nr:DUF721 domain-containing protein [Tannerellaceae bacterium]